MKKLCAPLTILIVFISVFSFAQDKKMIRIGVTQIVSHAALDADQKGFEDALSTSGFKEGVNVIYDRQNAQGDMMKANAIAQKFIEEKVDLIHSIATPTTQAVAKITRDIPVVFSSITDPISAGIVPKESAPGKKSGTNVTGVSDRWPVFLQMEMYAKFVPNAKQWGTIYNAAEANSVVHIKEMREAAKKLGLELVEATITNRSEVSQAVLSLVGKVQAIVISADNTAISDFETIVNKCNEKKIALFAGDVDSVQRGATAAYGLDYFLVGYAAGKKAVLVLKGLKPGEIPWGPMEKFSLVINASAAAAQGVTIPPDLLKKADKVIK
ncbi:MAG: ABC transporter substrate-binding protein [Deltaproteobacteria bacterium]|nr:ABC transporter substrate-binding protein [Deltaproteobacteria bacterium]